MELLVVGHDLPGRTFRDAGVPIHGIHIGRWSRRGPLDLVAGDAAETRWRVDLTPATREIRLVWCDVDADGRARPFRHARIDLTALDIDREQTAGSPPVELHISLTDAYGGPRSGPLTPDVRRT